ncbi:hypothetical protein [Leptolyngbya sp. FACHB-261]|uniref:hypothetical protein n=1 Tax=Leptolyngbya sp. FACHB-261 TaxID=2692806 RepID=UPI001684120A|nr:hypothetical protein [Leptolyngbya sp. FACHB-261]MBD2102808.1 hypothetical protein [Leptolyngbya sp. FACHB-261]
MPIPILEQAQVSKQAEQPAGSAETPTATRQGSLSSPPNANQPTQVALGFHLLNLGRINQTEETFNVTGFLYAFWQDPRLRFDPQQVGDQVVRYTPEQIWEPTLTIFNSQDLQKKGPVQLSAKPDGTVSYLELINVTVSSSLDLRKFPFDTQTARIIWEPLSSDVKGVSLVENPIATGYSREPYLSLSEWQTLGIETSVGSKKGEKEDKNYARYTYEIKIQRRSGFYLFKIVLPLMLITLVSWTAFWINPITSFVPQMNVGITSILTAITFNFTVANSLPRVPYVTLMDSYIFICYIFFFSSIISTVLIHFLLNNRAKPEPGLRLIRQSRWLFPLAFVGAQALLFATFLAS